ncbi:MAG: nucleotidyltransferase [Muribaculaceae bacterium]|nr:nucleotidyltransferase [Muribaculaceae bacterium]
MKPTLLVLAAGMGSRYGGLKQLDKLGPQGQTIMDYSIYDALKAGFGKVVFVIRRDFEDQFRKEVLSKYEGFIPVEVVFQDKDDLPEPYVCPTDRTRPWGTNHAVMAGRNVIKEPFAVINSDDFYGFDAFRTLAEYLSKLSLSHKGRYCMVAFQVGNTMSPNGYVSRGVCSVEDDGRLKKIIERTKIQYSHDGDIVFGGEEGASVVLTPDTPVSMNFWGFTPDYFDYSSREFNRFLTKYHDRNDKEFFIPSVVDKLIGGGDATVDVLTTDSQWFGVTYPGDRQGVVERLAFLHNEGFYPDNMFS